MVNDMRLIDAPVGLFMSKDGEMCLKTEYIAEWGVEAYIVSSGETYWGGAKTAEERNNLDVTPIDAVPVVRCKDCKHHRWVQEPCHGRTEHLCDLLKMEVFKDFFCWYGKRKDGEGNG